MASAAGSFFIFFAAIPEEMKYTAARAKRMPAKIKNVIAVPTAGILINVGTKVPMMLPTVFDALRFPTRRPLSSRLSVANLTREGVTVPSKKSGNTKITMHAAKPAITRKLLLTEKIRSPEIPRMMYLPSTGIKAIQIAAIITRAYRRSGSGFLSALRPP